MSTEAFGEGRKAGGFFPMFGKNERSFSNHWKNFFQPLESGLSNDWAACHAVALLCPSQAFVMEGRRLDPGSGRLNARTDPGDDPGDPSD